MKKMILLACVALGLAACDKDDACSRRQGQDDNVIHFYPSIVSADMDTRTAYSGSTASWISGDAIGVYADRPTGNPPANVQYSYNGTAWTTSTNLYWTDGTSVHKFLGYAPYAAANTTYTAVKLPSLTGQTGAIDPTKDFLISNNAWTTGVTRPASAPYSVSLVFTHALTLIEFDISVTGFAANTTLTNFTTAVSSGGALITSDATTSTINLTTGAITAGTTANTVTATPGTPPTLSATPHQALPADPAGHLYVAHARRQPERSRNGSQRASLGDRDYDFRAGDQIHLRRQRDPYSDHYLESGHHRLDLWYRRQRQCPALTGGRCRIRRYSETSVAWNRRFHATAFRSE